MKLSIVVVLMGIFVVAPIAGCSSLKHVDFSHVFSRKGWVKPQEVIGLLGVKAGMTIADLGAGSGYFSFELAQAVGPTGMVYAVEVDRDRQVTLREKILQRGIENIIVVDGTVSDPLLEDASVDLVFLCDAYHHFENREVYFKNLIQDLRENAHIAILDTKDTRFAHLVVPTGHWLDPGQITREMTVAGYALLADHDILPYNSFQVYGVKVND